MYNVLEKTVQLEDVNHHGSTSGKEIFGHLPPSNVIRTIAGGRNAGNRQ